MSRRHQPKRVYPPFEWQCPKCGWAPARYGTCPTFTYEPPALRFDDDTDDHDYIRTTCRQCGWWQLHPPFDRWQQAILAEEGQ